MPGKDEFNNVRITNEDKKTFFEFGKSPIDETPACADNPNNIKSEINDNPVSNNENKKPEEKKKLEENTKSNSTTQNSNTNHGKLQSSGGMVSAGAVAVAAAAIVVGVVNIGATPIPKETTKEINNVILTPSTTSIDYSFNLNKEIQESSYFVSLENEMLQYYESNEAVDGNNEGSFTNLREQTEYTFSISKTNINDETGEQAETILYEKVVGTTSAPDPSGTFTITYDANGGSGVMDPVTYTTNVDKVSDICIFVPPEDQEFGGWLINGEQDNYFDKTNFDKVDTTLVATWKPIQTSIETFYIDNSLVEYGFPTSPINTRIITNGTQINLEMRNIYIPETTGKVTFSIIDIAFIGNAADEGYIRTVTVQGNERQANTLSYAIYYSNDYINDTPDEFYEIKELAPGEEYVFVAPEDQYKFFYLTVIDPISEGILDGIVITYKHFTYNVYHYLINPGTGEGEIMAGPISGVPKIQLPSASEIYTDETRAFIGWKINDYPSIIPADTLIGVHCDFELVAIWEGDEGT